MISETIKKQAQSARNASIELANLSTSQKNQVLHQIAQEIREHTPSILSANQKDLQEAKALLDAEKITASLYQRLVLTENKIEQMALNLESVADLEDPVGKMLSATELDEGLELYRVSTPIGVLMVIFESRPEVVIQISALALKSGNAVILKGGSEAKNSNRMLVNIVVQALQSLDYIPNESIQFIESREDVRQLVQMDQEIDLIIPRGSASLVQNIQQHSTIPTLAHADGVCHVYLDAEAQEKMALDITIDSKTEYPAVCNALETLLVDEKFSDQALLEIVEALHDLNVELRVCSQTKTRLPTTHTLPLYDASKEDWQTEYTDLILSIKTVSSLEEAITHINRYGSQHTDAIVTKNEKRAETFLNFVDSASVFWNASTRFADGFRYGFGAEVGISTSRTHARGPVGLEGLVVYKYKLYGHGQVVAEYSQGEKNFTHKRLPTTG